MADPEIPEEPTPPDFLGHVKQVTMERIVSHMNGVGQSIISQYPMAEVQSWTIQREEAERIVATGELSVLSYTEVQAVSAAPFLVAVCAAQFGPAVPFQVRATQLWAKAVAVKANADLWAALSAFVNGLRARTADQVAAATTQDEVFTIESTTATELAAFRDAYVV